MLTKVTDLTTGDVFEFEGRQYVHILGIGFEGNSILTVVTFTLKDYQEGRVDRNIVFQFSQDTQIDVVDHVRREHAEIIRVFQGKRLVS